MKTTNYVYSNSTKLVPLSDDEPDNIDFHTACKLAGENPDDEELSLCTLGEDFECFPAGSPVLTGYQVQGHNFYIFEDK